MSDLPLGAPAYLVAVLASLIAVSAVLSRWVRADAVDRALVATVVGIATATAIPLVLGMLGLLSAGGYLVTVAAVGISAGIVLVRTPAGPQRAPAAWSFSGLAGLVVGGALAMLALVQVVQGLPSEHVDSFNHYVGSLATWFQQHSIWPLPYEPPGPSTSAEPGNATLMAIGTIFATGSDHLATFAVLPFGALAVIAGATVVRELGGRPDHGALASLAVIGSPVVFGTHTHSLASNLPAAAAMVAGVASLLRHRPEQDARWLVVAGCALGLAMGANYTVAPVVLLVAIGVAHWLRPRRHLVWLVPGFGLLAAPWFVRNWIATGNPIFPQGLRVGGLEILSGGRTPLLEFETSIVGHVLMGRWDVVERWGRLIAEMWGPAVLFAVGLIAVTVRGHRRWDRLAVAALAVAAALVYATTAYARADLTALELMESSLRNALPAVLLAAVVASTVIPSRLLLSLVFASFLYDAWYLVGGYGTRTGLEPGWVGVLVVLVLSVAMAGTVAAVGGRRPTPGPPVYVLGAVCAMLGFGGVLVHIDGVSRPTELERVLQNLNVREVTALGVSDVRSLVGSDLSREVDGVGGGIGSAEGSLDARCLTVALEHPDNEVLVVDFSASDVPDGWRPPDTWRHIASTSQGEVYALVRDSP